VATTGCSPPSSYSVSPPNPGECFVQLAKSRTEMFRRTTLQYRNLEAGA
jgi:hypothetical protein